MTYKLCNVCIIFQQLTLVLRFSTIVGYSVNQQFCTAPIWLEQCIPHKICVMLPLKSTLLQLGVSLLPLRFVSRN